MLHTALFEAPYRGLIEGHQRMHEAQQPACADGAGTRPTLSLRTPPVDPHNPPGVPWGVPRTPPSGPSLTPGTKHLAPASLDAERRSTFIRAKYVRLKWAQAELREARLGGEEGMGSTTGGENSGDDTTSGTTGG